MNDKTAVTENIIKLYSEKLKRSDITANSDFLDSGGDSLGIMSIITSLEEQYKIELDPREILMFPTPEKIAEIVVKSLNKTDSKTVESDAVKPDLRKEAVLPDDIVKSGEYEKPAHESTDIFITGATGFLGAFLIKDILLRNNATRVYCLTRCHDEYDGLDRIRSNMIHYNCWQNDFRRRITVVPGDLAKPHFAIENKLWDELSQKIDMIFHCGAVLNFLYPYSAMKQTNVLSTVEALRLAVNKKMKYFNYVSSYSVYDNPEHFGKNVLEDAPLSSPDGYFLGYSETKWVSEKIVRLAQKRGILSKIYRPGDITGTKADGVWAVRDLTSRMIIGCIQMKAVPIVQMPLNFTPVDYVSSAMTHIAFSNDGQNKAYNIINPKIGSSAELLKALYKCRIPVVPIPYSLWKTILKKSNMSGNALRILSCMFEDKDGGGDIITRHMESQPIYDMFNTRSALADSCIECPPMDSELLVSYIKYFKKAKLI